MMKLPLYSILLVGIYSCKPSAHKTIEIDEVNVSSSPSSGIGGANSVSSTGGAEFENTSTNNYGYSLKIPLNFPERADLEGDVRLLSITCDPVVKPETTSFRKLNSEFFGVLNAGVSMFGRATKCSSLVVADSRNVFFESTLNEFIVVPENTPLIDIAPDAMDEVTVQFSQIDLPQSSVIEGDC